MITRFGLKCGLYGLIFVSIGAAAVPIKVCQDDLPHPPFLFPDRAGTIQILLSLTAEKVGVVLDTHYVPIRRCQAEIESGDASARVASETPVTVQTMAFPKSGNKLDEKRAVAFARHMLFRVKGAKVAWDGNQFKDLHLPVMLQPGYVQSEARLAALHVTVDETGKDLAINFSKLIAGRGDLVVALEYDGQQMMKRPEFQGRVEMLPVPLAEVPYYFAFSKDYYEHHQDLVEKFWDQAAQLKSSQEYLLKSQALR